MRDESPQVAAPNETGDFIQFLNAGVSAKGEFHCSDCGYGVTVYRKLPPCPMCGCSTWEESTWSPFTRTSRRPVH
jgi:hypothetical protein